MKTLSATIALLLISSSVFSQVQENPKIKRVEFTSMSLSIGVISFREEFNNDLNSFRKLAHNSDILKQNIPQSGYNETYITSHTGPTFSAKTYFSIKNKSGESSKFHPQFSIGFTYANETLISNYFSTSKYYRVDTLVSNQSGNTYFVDSAKTDEYSMSYSREQIFLDAAFTISSNPANRFKLYGGLGFSIGVSFNSRTEIGKNQSNYMYTGVPMANNYSYPNTGNHQAEVYSNKEGIMALVSIPFGLEFRLSKRESTWGKCRLYFEGKPSIAYADVPELGSNIAAGGIWSAGLKYDF